MISKVQRKKTVVITLEPKPTQKREELLEI